MVSQGSLVVGELGSGVSDRADREPSLQRRLHELEARLAALQRAHSHAKWRVVRDVFALCPRCGQRYAYDEKTRTFRVLPGWAPSADLPPR